MENFDAIRDSPFKIYHFALPFCPSSSWLQKYYSVELSQAVKIVRGTPAEWGTCFRTVQLDNISGALSYRNNSIAVGLDSGNVIILDAITGSQTATLHGHTKDVLCLSFSLDGKLLVSGGNDTTVRLWDVQTGGVIRTFDNHGDPVHFVSIAGDCTKIASVSYDEIHLWNVQTGAGGYLLSIKSCNWLGHINFSPMNPSQLMSIHCGQIRQWDLNGHEVGTIYGHFHIIPSLEYVLFAGCNGQDVRVQSFESGAIVAEFHTSQVSPSYCCFSPDSKLVAVSSKDITEVWNIAGSNPHLIGIIHGCSGNIMFSSPSSLISSSKYHRSVKFWQIGILLAEPTLTDPKCITLSSAPIAFVSLQARDKIVITSNSAGVVEIWDLLTGLCKTSFQSPVTEHTLGDAKLINGELIFAWSTYWGVYIWESRNSSSPTQLGTSQPLNLMVSGDGTKIFWQNNITIEVWSVHTRQQLSGINLRHRVEYMDPLYVEGSRVWVRSRDLSTKGWDLGVSTSPPIILYNIHPSKRPRLDFIYGTKWGTGSCLIKDTITGKEVFRLIGKHAKPQVVKWDGLYLAAHYEGGEVLILDFGYFHSE